VAPSSFGCSVAGRTRVFLLWKGVDVLLGKTIQSSGKTEIDSIHSSSKAIHQTPRETQLPIWLPHIPRVLRSCDAFQIAAAVIPGTDHSRMQSWRQPILSHFFGDFLWGLAKKVTRLRPGPAKLRCFCRHPGSPGHWPNWRIVHNQLEYISRTTIKGPPGNRLAFYLSDASAPSSLVGEGWGEGGLIRESARLVQRRPALPAGHPDGCGPGR
jgi:hypothetical protein